MSLVTIQEASRWATERLEREVTPTNISYLVQYGKVRRHSEQGSVLVSLDDLEKYYSSWRGQRESEWKKKLGSDLNWALSFDHLREKDTTKHIHRLHPYKGKYIPQLVEYFIDGKTDNFKTGVYFKKGDVILDPFSGSGTTLVQASEMGIHSVGIDVSHFNCTISDVKLQTYDFDSLQQEINSIKQALEKYSNKNNIVAFEQELLQEIYKFNNQHFPNPSFRYQIQHNKINERNYAEEQEKEFLQIYNQLIAQHNINLKQNKADGFLGQWYCQNIRKEIEFVFGLIKKIHDVRNKKALAIILSRTIRSCRATTHSDLATLKEPQLTTYYCWKHKKICKPLYSIKYWFNRYADDTVARLKEFNTLRTSTPVSYTHLTLPTICSV